MYYVPSPGLDPGNMDLYMTDVPFQDLMAQQKRKRKGQVILKQLLWLHEKEGMIKVEGSRESSPGLSDGSLPYPHPLTWIGP